MARTCSFDHYPSAKDCDYLYNETIQLIGCPTKYECFWLKWKIAKDQNSYIRNVYLPILREAEADLVQEEPFDAKRHKFVCSQLIKLRGIISLIDIPDDKINGIVMFDTIDFLSRALNRANRNQPDKSAIDKTTGISLFIIEFGKALQELPSKRSDNPFSDDY